MVTRSEPIFAVRDIDQTLAFYRDVLGGQSEWRWGDPPTFGGIRLGEVQVMFGQQPDLAAKIEGHQHAFHTEQIDELHERHLAAGAPIVSPIANKSWGLREYTVRDPNGYHLRFGGPATYEKPPTALETMPEHIRIEPRLPTWEEYRDLHVAVDWGEPKDTPALLDRCCFGCVAVDSRSGAAVGMVRVINEGHGWYSVWDVIVRPEHQSQRIGTAMLEHALDHLRRNAPGGSWVYLFTHKHAFYQRLGFRNESCTMIRL